MRKLRYALAAAALLLVGGGCDAGITGRTTIESAPSPAAPSPVGADMPAAPKSELDMSIDALIDSAGEENAAETEREKNAGEVDADKAGMNAYDDASYDLK